jgi:hypothetical protein
MPQLTTYALAKAWPGIGQSYIADVFYLGASPIKKCVQLINVGDTLDLSKIDPVTFTKSSRKGNIASHVLSGRLSPVLQDVSDKVEYLFNQEVRLQFPNELMANIGGAGSGFGQVMSTVEEIEPGLLVGCGPSPSQQNTFVPPPAVNPVVESTEIEHGLMAGAPSTKTAPVVEEQDLSEVQSHDDIEVPESGPFDTGVKVDVGDGDSIEPGLVAGNNSVNTDWKKDLDLGSQKKFVAESSDIEFLNYVINPESKEVKVLQKLAANRIKEIK